MPSLPTLSDLFDEFKSTLEADPNYNFVDFSAGSTLRAFGGVAAAAGQSLLRDTLLRFSALYLRTAQGGDLDALALDRYDTAAARLPGELTEAYRQRLLAFHPSLRRGTPDALRVYGATLAGVVAVEVTEDLLAGIVTMTLTKTDAASAATVRAAALAGMDGWRSASVAVNVVVV